MICSKALTLNIIHFFQEFLPSLRTNPRRKSFHCDDVTPPRSPRFPSQSTLVAGNGNAVVACDLGNSLLLRRGENSPFAHQNPARSTGSTNSTPYSQISVPSSYDYEEDFTSDSESDISTMAINNRYCNPIDI